MTTTTTTTTTLPSDPRDFSDLVGREVRGWAIEEETATLRQPENLERWYDALVALKSDVEYQFTIGRAELETLHAEALKNPASKAKYYEEVAEYRSWQVAATRFLRGVETRIREAKRLRREARDKSFIVQVKRLCHRAARHVPVDNEGWHSEYTRLFERQS